MASQIFLSGSISATSSLSVIEGVSALGLHTRSNSRSQLSIPDILTVPEAGSVNGFDADWGLDDDGQSETSSCLVKLANVLY